MWTQALFFPHLSFGNFCSGMAKAFSSSTTLSAWSFCLYPQVLGQVATHFVSQCTSVLTYKVWNFFCLQRTESSKVFHLSNSYLKIICLLPFPLASEISRYKNLHKILELHETVFDAQDKRFRKICWALCKSFSTLAIFPCGQAWKTSLTFFLY